MMDASVCVIVLNWNRSDVTLACLDSLERGVPFLVVDNGSRPEALEQLRRSRSDVPLLALETNQGYAGGNNAGIRWALERGYEWVLLLNDDAVLAPGALEVLVNTANRDPQVGLAGPLVLHSSPPEMIQSAGGLLDRRWRASHRGQDQADVGQYTHPEEVSWLSGCALLARARMIHELGGLDERFFLYQEELEWCLRARRAGWKALFVPQARAWHAGVTSDYEPKPYVTYYMTRNRFLLLAKMRAGLLPWIDALFQTLRTLLSWTLRPKWRGKRAHRDALWQGLMDFARRRWGPLKTSSRME